MWSWKVGVTQALPSQNKWHITVIKFAHMLYIYIYTGYIKRVKGKEKSLCLQGWLIVYFVKRLMEITPFNLFTIFFYKFHMYLDLVPKYQ
jgi:hypothetical protein